VDIARVLSLLTDAHVDVVLVGGMAAVAHGVVHLTNDIDLCYNPDLANLERLVRALAPLHPRLRVEGLTDDQSSSLPFQWDARTILATELLTFSLPFQWDARTILATELLTLMTDAGRLDLIRMIPGVGDYADVHSVAVPLDVLGAHIDTLDLPALIESKRAVRRPKDLAALPHIEAVLRMREADAARDAENR